MKIRFGLAAAIAAISLTLAGCETPIERALGDAESALDTSGGTTVHFHSSVYFPNAVSLSFPGYVVGIEKSPLDRVAQDRKEIITHEITEAGKGVNKKAGLLKRSPKTFYVGHVSEYKGKQYGVENCSWYSVYYQLSKTLKTAKQKELLQFLPWCAGVGARGLPRLRDDIPDDTAAYAAAYDPDDRPTLGVLGESPYSSSWQALDVLRDRLRSQLKKPGGSYTHIVIVVMGWNTIQTEAYRNYNSIMANIWRNAQAPGETIGFNPLFIGVSWPSSWESDLADPVVKAASFRVKANDADEVGLSWLGALMREVLAPIKSEHPDLKVVAIGHSFGARALGMAVCVGPAIDRTERPVPRPAEPAAVDLFVGLQPAFSINRLFPDSGTEDIEFPGMCRNGIVAFTASEHDKAMRLAFGAPMVGNDKVRQRQCAEANPPFRCVKATPGGALDIASARPGDLVYVDANALIRFNVIGTGGGAHSDIHRHETGKLIWELIRLASGP